MPKLIALLLLFTLTTACARLSREESGCERMVYFSNVTAKARTRGARLVYKIIELSSFSSASLEGRASEASMVAGSDFSLYEVFFRLTVSSVWPSSAARFLDTRLAALSICFDSFSSVKISWIFVMLVFERSSGLRRH